MKWPFDFSGAEQVAIEPIGAGHTRGASEVHAALFARPWSDGEIAALLHKSNVLGFAARQTSADQAMIGFVLARQAADEAEILTIAVRPDWQRYGIGRRLMDAVLAHAHGERLASVFLEVEEANEAALALYRRLGFHPIGDRPAYYPRPGAEPARAIVMRRDIKQTARPR